MQAWLAICGRALNLDCKTRWSSTKDMVEVAIGLREQITVWHATLPQDVQNALLIMAEGLGKVREAEWLDIQRILEILTPFAEATSRATRSDQPISFVLPLYNFMYYAFDDFCNNSLWSRGEGR